MHFNWLPCGICTARKHFGLISSLERILPGIWTQPNSDIVIWGGGTLAIWVLFYYCLAHGVAVAKLALAKYLMDAFSIAISELLCRCVPGG